MKYFNKYEHTIYASYIGLLIAVVLYTIGGGLIEVLISPIVEACPTKKKPKRSILI